MHVNTAVDTFMSQPLNKNYLCIFLHVLQATHIVNDCRDFLRYSTKGFIVLAAFEVVGVTSSEDFKNKTQNLENKEEKSHFWRN